MKPRCDVHGKRRERGEATGEPDSDGETPGIGGIGPSGHGDAEHEAAQRIDDDQRRSERVLGRSATFDHHPARCTTDDTADEDAGEGSLHTGTLEFRDG